MLEVQKETGEQSQTAVYTEGLGKAYGAYL
jgi:hypothetical protein